MLAERVKSGLRNVRDTLVAEGASVGGVESVASTENRGEAAQDDRVGGGSSVPSSVTAPAAAATVGEVSGGKEDENRIDEEAAMDPFVRDLTPHFLPFRMVKMMNRRENEEKVKNRLQMLQFAVGGAAGGGAAASPRKKKMLSFRSGSSRLLSVEPVAYDPALAGAVQCEACGRGFARKKDRFVCPLCSCAAHTTTCATPFPLGPPDRAADAPSPEVQLCILCADTLDVAAKRDRHRRCVDEAMSSLLSKNYALLVQLRATIFEDLERIEGLLAEIGDEHTSLNTMDVRTAGEIAYDLENGFRDYDTLVNRVTKESPFAREDASPREQQMAKMLRAAFATALQDSLPRFRVMSKQLTRISEQPMKQVDVPEEAEEQLATDPANDPSINGLHPALSPLHGGMPVTLTVSNVSEDARFRVGTVDLPPHSVTRRSDSEFVIITPEQKSTGMYGISVTNPDSSVFVMRNALMYTDDAQVLAAILGGESRSPPPSPARSNPTTPVRSQGVVRHAPSTEVSPAARPPSSVSSPGSSQFSRVQQQPETEPQPQPLQFGDSGDDLDWPSAPQKSTRRAWG
jgi:IPT/TIG domain